MTRDALQRTAPSVADAAVGLVAIGTDAAGRLGRRMRPLTAPLFRAALDPPLLPATLHPSRLIDSLARRGALRRVEVRATAERWLEPVLPAVVDEVVDKLDLTALVLQRRPAVRASGPTPADKVTAAADGFVGGFGGR